MGDKFVFAQIHSMHKRLFPNWALGLGLAVGAGLAAAFPLWLVNQTPQVWVTTSSKKCSGKTRDICFESGLGGLLVVLSSRWGMLDSGSCAVTD